MKSTTVKIKFENINKARSDVCKIARLHATRHNKVKWSTAMRTAWSIARMSEAYRQKAIEENAVSRFTYYTVCGNVGRSLTNTDNGFTDYYQTESVNEECSKTDSSLFLNPRTEQFADAVATSNVLFVQYTDAVRLYKLWIKRIESDTENRDKNELFPTYKNVLWESCKNGIRKVKSDAKKNHFEVSYNAIHDDNEDEISVDELVGELQEDFAIFELKQSLKACCKDDIDLDIINLFFDGYRQTEIADELKMSDNAVKKRKQRILAIYAKSMTA